MSQRARLWKLATAVAITATAASAPVSAEARPQFPDVIALPDGWLPEGIAIGPGSTFYAGSRADGAVYRGDVRTGQGEVFIDGAPGRVAVGLEYDARCGLLFVAGGATGQGHVFDAETGRSVASFQFTAPPTFVNDVTVTDDAAYFTDSQRAVLFRVGLSSCATPGPVSTIELAGDWTQVAGATNANGIVAHARDERLIVVNSATGGLFHVDAATGIAALIDAPAVPAGDGLLLRGSTLYVVQNRLNQIAVVKLDAAWGSGRLVDVLTDADLDIPTTVARFGNALYAVNGRFTTPPTPTTPYQIVRVRLT